ncbi:MAG TPA: DNA-protecting protein DprA, partial [Pseudoxanthomonas sp.]|nr:DNA-protecting protein DprA [Pseudoxanthomonas sp.]
MSSQTLALLKLTLAGGPVMPRRTLLDTYGEPARCLAAGALAWRAAGLADTQIQRLRQPDEETLQRAIR